MDDSKVAKQNMDFGSKFNFNTDLPFYSKTILRKYWFLIIYINNNDHNVEPCSIPWFKSDSANSLSYLFTLSTPELVSKT